HPLGEAIVAEAGNREIKLVNPDGFRNQAGMGVSAEIQGRKVIVGNPKILVNGVTIPESIREDIEGFQSEAKTVMLVMIEGKIAGLIMVADQIKEGTKKAIDQIKAMGI